MKRAFLMAVGLISVFLAVLGILLPLLPTTPFLLLAGFCFARSSPRFHGWLMTHRMLGGYIRAYQEGTLDTRMRWRTIVLLWLTLAASALLLQPSLHLRVLLIAVGIGVSWHLLAIRAGWRPRSTPCAGGKAAEAGHSGHAVEANGPQRTP